MGATTKLIHLHELNNFYVWKILVQLNKTWFWINAVLDRKNRNSRFCLLVTARVRSTREGNVLTSVCPSIHPSVCPQGGVPISHNALQHFPECHGAAGGGYLTGYPPRPGYPPTPEGYPGQGGTRSGTPPGGVPWPGVYPGQVPPRGGTQTPQGGTLVRYPPGGGYPVRYPPGGVRPPGGVPRPPLGGSSPPGGVNVKINNYKLIQFSPYYSLPLQGSQVHLRVVCLLRSRRRTFLFLKLNSSIDELLWWIN